MVVDKGPAGVDDKAEVSVVAKSIRTVSVSWKRLQLHPRGKCCLLLHSVCYYHELALLCDRCSLSIDAMMWPSCLLGAWCAIMYSAPAAHLSWPALYGISVGACVKSFMLYGEKGFDFFVRGFLVLIIIMKLWISLGGVLNNGRGKGGCKGAHDPQDKPGLFIGPLYCTLWCCGIDVNRCIRG